MKSQTSTISSDKTFYLFDNQRLPKFTKAWIKNKPPFNNKPPFGNKPLFVNKAFFDNKPPFYNKPPFDSKPSFGL